MFTYEIEEQGTGDTLLLYNEKEYSQIQFIGMINEFLEGDDVEEEDLIEFLINKFGFTRTKNS
ncbi:hypothetical protein RAC89_22085 [Paenibacillus sp. GD4]|jgi:hypothetical protein|uniref:hypothetical protein n=1 Tax=Paenibacillus sp. GD4 TaxID=3068890 RepID=UPI0027963FF3|nr:hypothetical protein [Paenibacillus sp. GD4]MDQ1913087.1 hypothetical protein [Paenibacillus sp. GD4]